MAEIIDEYIAFDERVPAPSGMAQHEPNTPAPEQVSQSAPGNAVSRFFERMIDTGADQGWVINSALQSAIYPEKHQAYEQNRANAARLAELQLKQSEMNLQKNAFLFEQAKLNAPIEHQLKQQQLNNARQTGENLALQHAQSKERHPFQIASVSLMQHNAWNKDADAFFYKGMNNIKNMSNYNQLNVVGKHIIDNSQSAKALVEMTYLMQTAKRNPEQFKYMVGKLQDEGWIQASREDGELALEKTLDGKKTTFVANPEGLKKLSEIVQNRLKDDLTAAKIVGLDAHTPAQATAKTILQNPEVVKVCGNDSTAYRVYSDFFNKKMMTKSGEVKEVFSPEQKMYHMLNVTIGAAIEDNLFSDEEKVNLIPQVQGMIKVLGGELKLGKDVSDTVVVWGRNQGYAQTYTLKDFLHTVLKNKDTITPLFGSHLSNLQTQMQKNKAAQEEGNKLTPGEFAHYSYVYGTDFTKLAPEVAVNVKVAENQIKNIALQEGVITRDKDGKISFKGTLDDLKRIADSEKALYDYLGLKDIASKGYFATVYALTKAKEEKIRAAKAKQGATVNQGKAYKMLEKSKSGNFFERMAAGSAYDAYVGASVAQMRGQKKENDADAEAATQQGKLERRGK